MKHMPARKTKYFFILEVFHAHRTTRVLLLHGRVHLQCGQGGNGLLGCRGGRRLVHAKEMVHEVLHGTGVVHRHNEEDDGYIALPCWFGGGARGLHSAN